MPKPIISDKPGDIAGWKRRTALLGALICAITLLVSRVQGSFFPLYQLQSQDLLPLFVLAGSLMATAFWTPKWPLRAQSLPNGILCLFGIGAAGLLAWGSYSIMGNFPLSADERMVVFDMAVFDRMQLAQPLAADWRPFVRFLVPAFLLSENMPTGLVSAYLPMNALLRLAFSKAADPVLFNPLLALAGGAAIVDIARRTFRGDKQACLVVLLIYVLSAQMLVNAMTVYSMTSHMALNLIWLAAFLRGGRFGVALAILTGFVATGLHQVAFHPFFVAPFLLWRLTQGQWKTVLIYGAAYGAIVLWWAYYPILAGHEVASIAQQPKNSGLAERISGALAERRGDTLVTMSFNLLRFFAWQNLALLPLLSAGIVVSIRERGFCGVLLLGIVLWLAFIAAVIPFQGHGWGYRYLSPYLGSFALLAGFGYQHLRAVIGPKINDFVLTLSAVTAFAIIPLLMLAAHRFVEPYVGIERLIARQPTPFVLIDTGLGPTLNGDWEGNAIENVRNLPDLSNRPLRVSSRNLDSALLAELCRKGPITIITRADGRRAGFGLNLPSYSPAFEALIVGAERTAPGCFRQAVR